MSKAIIFVSAGMIGVFLVVSPAGAQVAPQTVELAKVNVQKLAAGYRASKVIGSSVTNDANETIGNIYGSIVVTSNGIANLTFHLPDGSAPVATYCW